MHLDLVALLPASLLDRRTRAPDERAPEMDAAPEQVAFGHLEAAAKRSHARRAEIEPRHRDRPALLELDHEHDAIARDRKSTRLNSSHSQISYAVFCLKKKKKK